MLFSEKSLILFRHERKLLVLEIESSSSKVAIDEALTEMDDNQIYRYFSDVNGRGEVSMDNELLVEMKIDLVILHN
jgi:hypothetical protein